MLSRLSDTLLLSSHPLSDSSTSYSLSSSMKSLSNVSGKKNSLTSNLLFTIKSNSTHDAIGSGRVLPLRWEEVCIKTSSHRAVLSTKPKTEFAECRAHSAGDVSTSASNKGLVSTSESNKGFVSTSASNKRLVSTSASNKGLVSTSESNKRLVSTSVSNKRLVSTSESNKKLVSTSASNKRLVSTVSIHHHEQLHAFTSVHTFKIPKSMSEFGGLRKH